MSERITSSNTFEELEKIISDLNEQFTHKGEYGAILSQIETSETTMAKFIRELKIIDEGLFSVDFRNKVDGQLSKFNDIFSNISDELYDERYSVKEDIVLNSKGQSIYIFSVIGTNLSAGKKLGEQRTHSVRCLNIGRQTSCRAEERRILCG